MSRSVFVSGAVAEPGRYGFETMPSLLDVLNQAGGALPDADLTHVVQVVRREPADGAQIQRRPGARRCGRAPSAGCRSSTPGDVIVVPASASAAGQRHAPTRVGRAGRGRRSPGSTRSATAWTCGWRWRWRAVRPPRGDLRRRPACSPRTTTVRDGGDRQPAGDARPRQPRAVHGQARRHRVRRRQGHRASGPGCVRCWPSRRDVAQPDRARSRCYNNAEADARPPSHRRPRRSTCADFLRVLTRRKLLLVAAVGASRSAGVAAAFLLQPIYFSDVTLLLERPQALSGPLGGMVGTRRSGAAGRRHARAGAEQPVPAQRDHARPG